MDKSVLICGLYQDDYAGIDMRNLPVNFDEIWTCNDWYTYLPWLQPDKVWNIHDNGKHIHPAPHRFVDWVDWYKRIIKKGAKIVVREHLNCIDIDDCEIINMQRLTACSPPETWACSISMQISEAVLQGFNTINVMGARFNSEEYDGQPLSCYRAVEFARDCGIKVNIFPDGRESQWALDVMLNPQKTITPYWMR